MHLDVYKRPLFLFLLALIIGLLLFYKPAPTTTDVFHFIPQKDVTLVGRVERFYTAKPTSNNVIVKVFTVDGKPATGYVYARLKNMRPQWKDTLEIAGRLQEPYGTELLGNFNWRSYLAYKQVFTEIKSENARVIKSAAWFYRALRSVREDILCVFAQSFPDELAPIAGGVLLGERGELSPALFAAFQDSGAIHLLVASGGNVGFVTLMTLAFCGLFGLTRRKALWAALLVAGIYTLIAGEDAPLMRAYFMTICACGGYYLGRNSGVWQGLVLSCVIILLIYPASLFETGFQMSFLATASLIICLNNYPIPYRWPKWVRFFAQIFMVTLAVQLALLPIFANVFYKVSLTGLVANMLLVPLASILLGLSFTYYVCSLCHVGILLYYPTVFCLQLFKYLVEFFAAVPFSAVPVTAWGIGTIVTYYVGLFWLLHARNAKGRKRLAVVAGIVMMGALIGQFLLRPQGRVYLLDEWYKSVAIVELKNGDVFVVGGTLAPEKIKNALYKIGRKQATAVLLNAPDSKKYDYQTLAPTVLHAFADVWAEDTLTLGKTTVRATWGMHVTKDGRIWYNTGYTGSKKDELSYCFTTKKTPKFCVGAGARFVQTAHGIVPAEVNQTVEVKL